MTVVVNHQLVPNVQYPGGANDMQLARQWVYDNTSKPEFGGGSTEKVFLFGHSSGGAHVAMNLYAGGEHETAGPPRENSDIVSADGCSRRPRKDSSTAALPSCGRSPLTRCTILVRYQEACQKQNDPQLLWDGFERCLGR